MWPYLALGGDGDEAGKHKQAVLGTEEDLWPPSFCKIGGGLRAPKGFRHVGATPAPTTPLLKIPVFPREALPGRPEHGASPGLLEGEKLPPKKGAWQLGLPSWVLCREQGTRGAHPAGSRETNHEQRSSPALPLLPPPCSVPGAVPAAAAAPRWCRFCWLSQDNSLPFPLLGQPGRLSCAGRLSIPQGSCANSGETEAGSVWRL